MPGKEKLSLTLDADLLHEARRRVGKRELSSLVNAALEHWLQSDSIARYLDEADGRLGPVAESVAAAVEEAFELRFDRTREARVRRRIREALGTENVSLLAPIGSEDPSGARGIDLWALAERASAAGVPLASILGARPLVAIDGEGVVRIVDVDPRREIPQ